MFELHILIYTKNNLNKTIFAYLQVPKNDRV